MDFRLTKQQEMMQKLCREFAVNEVEPIAAEIDEQERYPYETVEKLRRYGMMGIQFPKELGGSGGDTICYSIAIEEASKFCATTGCIISSHATLGAWPIYKYGTPEQKEKWLRPLISGQKTGAFGLTEPNAGTDSAAQDTIAEKREDGTYLLNGSKVFITGGGIASTYIIFAMTNKAFLPSSSRPMIRALRSVRLSTRWASAAHKLRKSSLKILFCPQTACWARKTAALRSR